MKKTLIAALALLLALCAPALAFDFTRFDGVEDVEIEYDPADPTAYNVRAGFGSSGEWTQFGGHLVVRYMNAGRTEELPLIVVSFTTNGSAAAHLEIRTDAHRYEAVCTDLTQAGMSAVATEAPLLVTPDSVGMLSDIAASAYARVEVVGEDGETSLSFMVDDQARGLLSLFLEEYEQEIVPMLSDGSSLLRVYDALTPVITAEDADDLTAEAQAIRAAEYVELQNGSTGDEVAQLQQMLVNLGYLSGGVDGIFGGNTASAIEAFQQSAGLEATGVADANTQAALYLAGLFEGFSLEAPAEEPAESAE